MFGRSSEKLTPTRSNSFRWRRRTKREKSTPPLWRRLTRHEPEPTAMPVAGSDGLRTCRLSRKSSIAGKCRSLEASARSAFDRCGGERTARLRTWTVPTPAIGSPLIRAAWGPGGDSCDRSTAAEPEGALHCSARTSAQIIVSKFADHLPLYRQEAIFGNRHGVHLPHQSMVLDGTGGRLAATHL